MVHFFIFALILTQLLLADVRSTNGVIKFDINDDAQEEMLLNATGLGIGVVPSANLEVDGNAIFSNQLFIGAQQGSGNLNLNGTIGFSLETVSDNTTWDGGSIILADASAGNIIVTLPFAGNAAGRVYEVKKISTSNRVIISGGGNLIDGSDYFVMTSGNKSSLYLISNGNQWYVLNSEDSDPAWTPDNLSPSLWLDAADSSTVLAGASDNVYQWNDKSGNDYHAVQASDSSQALTGANVINGKNTITFNDNDYYKVNTAIFNTRATMNASIFIVLRKLNEETDFDAVLGGRNGSSTLSYFELGLHNNVGRFNTRSSPFLDTNNHGDLMETDVRNSVVLMAQTTSTTLKCYANGDLESDLSTTTMTPTTGNDGVNIGHRFDSGGSGGLVGLIGEVIIYQDIDLSTDDRQKIEGYLAHKWGLESDLPDSHPFKIAAP